MSNLKLLGGDFHPKDGWAVTGLLGQAILIQSQGLSTKEKVNLLKEAVAVEMVDDESQKRFAGTAVKGAVGGLLLGPVGLLAGVMSGGNKREVVFACQVRDGRRAFLQSDGDFYKRVLKAALANA